MFFFKNSKILRGRQQKMDPILDLKNKNFTSKDIRAKLFRGYEHVDLSQNKIKTLKEFPRLPQVKSLNLSKNALTEFRHVGDFLRKLDLSYNYFDNISGLQNLHRLVSLSLAGNWITECTGLENLTRLNFLDLRENLIDSFGSVRSLSFNTSLRTLLLEGNPIARLGGAYGLSILNLLPHIDTVDRWTRFRKKKKRKENAREEAVPLLLLKDLPSKKNASARSVKSTSSYAEIHLGIRTPRSETRTQEKNAIVCLSVHNNHTLSSSLSHSMQVLHRRMETPMKRLNFDDDMFEKSTTLRVRPVDENKSASTKRRIPKSAMKAKRWISLQSHKNMNRMREIFENIDRSNTGTLPMETVVDTLCRHVSGMTRDEAEDLCCVNSVQDDLVRYSNVLPYTMSRTSSIRERNVTTVKKKKKSGTLNVERGDKKMNREKLCILRNKLRAASYVGTKGKNIRVLFERLDKDHNGYLSRSEFEHALRKRLRLSRTELNTLWNIVDRDESGTVDLEEFSRFINLEKKKKEIQKRREADDKTSSLAFDTISEKKKVPESDEIERLIERMILTKESALKKVKSFSRV